MGPQFRLTSPPLSIHLMSLQDALLGCLFEQKSYGDILVDWTNWLVHVVAQAYISLLLPVYEEIRLVCIVYSLHVSVRVRCYLILVSFVFPKAAFTSSTHLIKRLHSFGEFGVLDHLLEAGGQFIFHAHLWLHLRFFCDIRWREHLILFQANCHMRLLVIVSKAWILCDGIRIFRIIGLGSQNCILTFLNVSLGIWDAICSFGA